MQLQCNACHHPISAADINVDLGIAKCSVCNGVFSFLESLGHLPKKRPIVERPKRFEVEQWSGDFVIRRGWYQHGVWPMLGFCVFWDGFLIFWYSAAIGSLVRGDDSSGMIWTALLFPILHLGFGIGLTYAVVCTFINRTVIRVASGELSVRHGPLPCRGNCRIFVADIKQIYCTEKKTRGEDSWHRTYNVVALKKDNTKSDLVTGLENCDYAWFIEQQLEQHLKIADERVAGEYMTMRDSASA